MTQESIPAGWYYMEGDPQGSQRWWDGVQWTAETQTVQAPPPQVMAPQPEAVLEPVGASPQNAAAPVEEEPAAVEYGSMLANDLASYWDTMEEKVDPAAQFTQEYAAALEAEPDPFDSDGDGGGHLTPSFDTRPSVESPFTWMFLPYKHFAQFKGRSCRAEYWWYTLFQTVVSMGLYVAGFMLIAASPNPEEPSTAGLALLGLMFVFSLISAIPTWAVTVRRLHDTGRSGWAMFIGIIPIIGFIWLLIIYVTPGNGGWNKYGNEHIRPT